MKALRIALLAVVAALAAGFVAFGLPEDARGVPSELGDGITVTGTGAVSSVPDRADLSFGVVTEAKTARGALAANSAAIAKVIAALKSAGVAATDIQTESLSLGQRYGNDGETLVGYTAQNSVRAKLRDLNRAGAVIDEAVEAGADQVYGPTLSRGDRSELYRTALRGALAEAKSKAQAIANAAGVSLGRVTTVTEASYSPPPLELSKGSDSVSARPVGAAPAVPIEAGTDRIEAQVSVTYAVQ